MPLIPDTQPSAPGLTVHVGRVPALGCTFLRPEHIYPERDVDVYQATDRARQILEIARERAVVVATNSSDVLGVLILGATMPARFILHRGDGTEVEMGGAELRRAVAVAGVDFRRL